MNNLAICGDNSMKHGTQEVKIHSGESIRREVQTKVSDVELGWLCGMITGEGSIGAYLVTESRADRPDLDGRLAFRVSVKIAGGMLEDIEAIKRICESLGVKVHVTWVKRKEREFFVGNAEINGQANVARLLQRVLPYVGSKQPQAALMLEIITYRQSLIRPGNPGHEANNDPKLHELIKRLSAMKKEGRQTESLNDCTPGAKYYQKRSLISKLTRAINKAPKDQVASILRNLADDTV
jgi:hypothetical protein